ncbi:MAG: energy transducer TonB [Bryobacteraceae bacterium]
MRVDSAEQQKRLVHEVRPLYPDVARQAGIEGTVEMRILIDKDGKVENVRPISGERVLLDAAMDAVRQWRYRPMELEGKPVPVMTLVSVEFKLQ